MLLNLFLSIDLAILLIYSFNFLRYQKKGKKLEIYEYSKTQSHIREEWNREWLDDLINKIENMKNKISSTFNLLRFLLFIELSNTFNTFVFKSPGFFIF